MSIKTKNDDLATPEKEQRTIKYEYFIKTIEKARENPNLEYTLSKAINPLGLSDEFRDKINELQSKVYVLKQSNSIGLNEIK